MLTDSKLTDVPSTSTLKPLPLRWDFFLRKAASKIGELVILLLSWSQIRFGCDTPKITMQLPVLSSGPVSGLALE